ncbi:MAG: T9SS type A sorting domain-containing protein [Candidatus Kapaibacterium sp.]
MKRNNLLYIVIILIVNVAIYAENYKITPMNIDFNGVISIDDNVVIYGSNGYYYYSEDAAKTWEERKLVEQANIKKIVKYKDDFYGIIESGALIKSTDKGNSWIVREYDKDPIDKFIAMDIDQDKFFVRSIDKIIEFNLDLEFQSLYQDSLLFYNENDSTYKSVLARDLLAYHNGKLYIPLSNKNLLIVSDIYKLLINKYLEDFSPILKGKKPYISRLDYINDSLMIEIKIVINSKPYKYIFLIGEDNYENDWKILPVDIIAHTNYKQYKDNLYDIDQEFLLQDESNKNWRYDFRIPLNLFLKKYDLKNDKVETVSNKYFPNYTLGDIEIDDFGTWGTGYSLFDLNSPHFIDDSTILVVGRNKSLFITYDSGKNWELKSFVQGVPNKIYDDKMYITGGIYSSISNDGGMTYTPQRITDTSACHTCRFTDIYQTFISPEGKGFLHGRVQFDNYSNIGFTQDFGRTFQYKSAIEFYSNGFKFATNFALIGDEYYNIMNRKTSSSNPLLTSKWVTYGYYFDKHDFSKYRQVVLDTSKHQYYYIYPENETNYTEVLQSIEANHPKDQYLEIRSTTDKGESWTSDHRIKNYSESYKFYEHNKDSLFITSYNLTYYGDIDYMNRVYLYDRTRGVLDTLFIENDIERKNLQVVYFDNSFYLMGDKILKKANKDLSSWDEVPTWPSKNPTFGDVVSSNDVLLVKYNDEIRQEKNFYLNNYYKIVVDKTTNIESPKITLRTYSAYPNPATNLVKAELYWESGFDIRKSIKGVYDINGNLVADKNAIILTNTDNYSGTLEWNCSNYKSGLYFIFIEHGDNRQSVPIMIMK